MQRLEWIYEVPAAGAPAAGLEEYVVLGSDGETLGKVLELLRRDGELWLVVDVGTLPLRPDRKAVAWELVGDVDHDTLTVVLRVRADELDDLPTLDPSNGVEPLGEGHAAGVDAVRVADVPAGLRPRTQPPGSLAGPVDRPTFAVALFVAALGLFTLLVAVAMVALVDESWILALFAFPAFLLAAAAVLAYRSWRLPYEPG